jgi:heme-degrading monooxygenase HmoA
MLCALTVRQLKPGSTEDFFEAFRPSGDAAPTGWKRFHAVRDVNDENRVITFGFFDGTLEELGASQEDHGYAERRASAEQYVEDVIVNGVFEVMFTMEAEAAGSTG